jgi:hypothetical protein
MPAAKRKSRNDLTIECPTLNALSSIVHAVANVAENIVFRVQDDMISTQTVCSAKSCMVSAKIHCSITGESALPTFAVNARSLLARAHLRRGHRHAAGGRQQQPRVHDGVDAAHDGR